jgi:hypothetical protein
VQRDDGRFRLGLYDDGPGFETRTFAASVLAHERPPPGLQMRSPPVGADGTIRETKDEPQQDTKSAMHLQEVSTSWGSA